MKVKIDLEKVYKQRVKPKLTSREAEMMEKALRDVSNHTVLSRNKFIPV